MNTNISDESVIHDLNYFRRSPDFNKTKKFKSNKMKKGLQSPSLQSIEIIQDFKMPDVCTSIQMTDDEDFIFVAGNYTPRVRCFDVNNISMKFERCMDYEVIKIGTMSKSFHSMAFLQYNKQLEIHNGRGRRYTLPTPSYGRDLSFLHFSQQLIVVGSCPEIFQVDMSQGSLSTSLKSKAKELNCCAANDHLNIFMTGSIEGLIESWDPRTEKSSNSTFLSSESKATSMSIFDEHNFAVGTSESQVFILDNRWLETPVNIKGDLGGQVHKVVCRRRSGEEDVILSADDTSIKMWCKDSGQAFAEVIPGSKVNDFLLIPGTGLMFVASECSDVLSYFIPDLGGSPKWCNILSCLGSKEQFLNKS